MSNIRLFPDDATSFSGLGLGKISDAISCKVTEERNGIFELEMEYPINGIRYNDILLRNIIVCPPNPFDPPQAFRIYSISKEYEKHITVNAQHISYDLSDVIAYNAEIQLGDLNPNHIWNGVELAPDSSKGNFTFTSDLTVDDSIVNKEGSHLVEYLLKAPKSLRNLLLGTGDDTLVSCYIGDDVAGDAPEYKFDNFAISLLKNRGQNRGAVIKYNKNMTGFTQEESMEKVFTRVYPFYYADSATYTKGGDEEGEQEEIENFRLDLRAYYNHHIYKTYPYIDLGIRDNYDDPTNERTLVLDVSSLYDGMYGVTFTGGTVVTNPYYKDDMPLYGTLQFEYCLVGDIKQDWVIIAPGEEKEVYCTVSSFDYDRFPGVTSFNRHYFDIPFVYVADHSEHNAEYGVITLLSNITVEHNPEDLWFDPVSVTDPNAFIPVSTGGTIRSTPHVKIKIRNVDKARKEISPGVWDEGNITLTAQNGGSNICEIEAPKTTKYRGIDLRDKECLRVGAMQIEAAAKKYIQENRLDQYPVSLSVDINSLSPNDTTRYDDIRLCDKVKVIYPDYNVSTTAKCTKTEYDAIAERYESLDFSNAWSDYAFTVAKANDRIDRYYSTTLATLNYLKQMDALIRKNK